MDRVTAMYRRILVPLENSAYDEAILRHVTDMAHSCGAAVLLVHVADGWVARHYDELALRESEEMKEDRAYLETVQRQLTANGFATRAQLAMGDPATELARVAKAEAVDLIAMSTHGHRFLNDLLRGSTADRLRHNVEVPVLMMKAR